MVTVTVPSGELAASTAEYPQVHEGVRYRYEPDGSVIVATAVGPKRFKNWQEFWCQVN